MSTIRFDAAHAAHSPAHTPAPHGQPSDASLSHVRINGRGEAHGESKTRLYRAWRGMRQRCTSNGEHVVRHYKDRGIRTCKGWDRSYSAFARWARSPAGGYRDDLTLDRIDNDGSYTCGSCPECVARGEPLNCRWTTPLVQSRNRTFNVVLTAFGESKPVSMWREDERCAVSHQAVYSRVLRGWPHEVAITTPPLPRGSSFLPMGRRPGKLTGTETGLGPDHAGQ